MAHWSKTQGNAAVKAAKARMGTGWQLLSPELRKGLVAIEIVSTMLVQAEETVAQNPALASMIEMAQVAYTAIEPE
jgi:hypothetical protein